jgi:hypothetical protein
LKRLSSELPSAASPSIHVYLVGFEETLQNIIQFEANSSRELHSFPRRGMVLRPTTIGRRPLLTAHTGAGLSGVLSRSGIRSPTNQLNTVVQRIRAIVFNHSTSVVLPYEHLAISM